MQTNQIKMTERITLSGDFNNFKFCLIIFLLILLILIFDHLQPYTSNHSTIIYYSTFRRMVESINSKDVEFISKERKNY